MTWWLSFCDTRRPEGSQFLGASIVEGGDNIGEAITLAHLLGCNPGGEVQGFPVPDVAAARVSGKWRHRLLTRAECEAFDTEHTQ